MWENWQALIMTLEWKTYVWFLVWKFSKKLLFLQNERQFDEECMNFQVFPWLSFCLNQNHICTLCFNTFQSPFFSAVFWAPIFLVYQAISLCIKYIASVMIRCASAHTHILQKFYFFSPLLSLSFQLVTNGIDLKSLLIFRSSSWDGNLAKVIPPS